MTTKKKDEEEKKNKNELFKRGNYSLLHLLTILNAAGDEGMPTLNS
jgi:hypothetical protein